MHYLKHKLHNLVKYIYYHFLFLDNRFTFVTKEVRLASVYMCAIHDITSNDKQSHQLLTSQLLYRNYSNEKLLVMVLIQ